MATRKKPAAKKAAPAKAVAKKSAAKTSIVTTGIGSTATLAAVRDLATVLDEYNLGEVTVTRGTETARGNVGIYDFNSRIITLVGNVALRRGEVARYPADVAPFLGVAHAQVEVGETLDALVPEGDEALPCDR